MLAPVSASAAYQSGGAEVSLFTQKDLDGNGLPDVAFIQAVYMGLRFVVTVYDQGFDMPWSDDWRNGTDFLNDTWLFQSEAGDRTRLVVRFNSSETGYQAELYDDVDGDGDVSIDKELLPKVKVSESVFPTARVVARQPWLLSNGNVNYMVSISIYRPMPMVVQEGAVSYLPHDGRVAITEEVVDSDADGIPDFSLMQAFPDTPEDWTVFRTRLNVNVGKEPASEFKNFIFWPYLGYTDTNLWSSGLLNRRPETLSMPPILVDWESGRIKGIMDFLPLYGANDRWILYSFQPIVKNAVTTLDQERFAYFNFAGSSTMDMVFRLVQSSSADTVKSGGETRHLQQVSFSWHHRSLGTMAWDYKLELAGLHELPSTVVDFKDFSLREVPFSDLLSHFTAEDWAFATFVAAEDNQYITNEGLWEWNTLDIVFNDVADMATGKGVAGSRAGLRGYLTGEKDTSPAVFYTAIRRGFRGEYADLNSQAQLYFSPIDRKLHLLRAAHGVWNLGDGRELRYQNLGGNYINRWTLLDGGREVRNLYAAAGHLVYQYDNGFQLIRAAAPQALFTALPPRDRAEWETLGRALEANQPAFAPHDFSAMALQFGGPALTVNGAGLGDFRLLPGGFRFVLDLKSSPTFAGEDWLGLQGRAPGRYLVTYDGAFHVQPLTPPSLAFASPLQPAPAGPLTTWTTRGLRVVLRNDGLEDARRVAVELAVTPPGRPEVWLEPQEVAVLSGGEMPVTFDLTPAWAGPWRMRLFARVLDENGVELSHASLEADIAVSEAPHTSRLQEVTAFGVIEPWQVAALVAILVLAAALTAWAFWRSGGEVAGGQ